MTQDNGNGRVTMAILGEQMHQVLAMQQKMDTRLERIETSQTQAASRCDKCETRQDQRWEAHGKAHETADTKRTQGDWIAYGLGLIAAVLGIAIKPGP